MVPNVAVNILSENNIETRHSLSSYNQLPSDLDRRLKNFLNFHSKPALSQVVAVIEENTVRNVPEIGLTLPGIAPAVVTKSVGHRLKFLASIFLFAWGSPLPTVVDFHPILFQSRWVLYAEGSVWHLPL